MWDRDLTKKLIEEYENYTVLWDISSADYKNKYKKKNAYRKIAENLEKSEEDIKTKIHHLRTQFMQEVRRMKQKKSGQATAENYTSKWEFFEALKFIISDKRTNYSIQNLDLSADESTVNNIFVKELPCSANSSITIDDVPCTSKTKRRKRDEMQYNCEDLLIKKAIAIMDKPVDDYQVFGDFVASELRLLKSNQNSLLLRRKIQRAILEVSEMDSEGTFTFCKKLKTRVNTNAIYCTK